MVILVGPPVSAIRNQPVSAELLEILMFAATQARIDEIRITSGGQDALGRGSEERDLLATTMDELLTCNAGRMAQPCPSPIQKHQPLWKHL